MIIIFFEILACLTGLAAWKSANPVYLKIIIILLVITSVNETIEESLPMLIKREYRMIIYNCFSLLEIGFWIFFFSMVFSGNKKLFRLLVTLSGLVLLFSTVELFGYRGWKRLHVDSYRFYSLCIILFSVLYLLKIIKLNDVYYPTKDPLFWFCAGCIIFQSVFFVHLTVINIRAFNNDRESIRVFNTLLDLANIFYYSLLCIGFYTSLRNHWKHKQQFSKM